MAFGAAAAPNAMQTSSAGCKPPPNVTSQQAYFLHEDGNCLGFWGYDEKNSSGAVGRELNRKCLFPSRLSILTVKHMHNFMLLGFLHEVFFIPELCEVKKLVQTP